MTSTNGTPSALPTTGGGTLLDFPVENPVTTIQTVVARAYDVTVLDIKSGRRDISAVRARHIAIYIARKLTPYSLPALGRAFGGRDHTTIMHAVSQVERKLACDPAYGREVANLHAHLRSMIGNGTEIDGLIDETVERITVRLKQRARLDPEGVLKGLMKLCELS